MKYKSQFSLLFSLLLVSCSTLQQQKTYNVRFEANGGTAVQDLTVSENSLLTIPETSKEGHTLEGWYTSINNGVTYIDQWNFFTDRVNFDLTLYAEWIINTYVINFETNGGSSVDSISGEFNSTFEFPTTNKLGYTFAGWYLENTFENVFTSNIIPSRNITLYANWNVGLFTISFETYGGETIVPITQEYGSLLTLPVPIKFENTFYAWYLDDEFLYIFENDGTMPGLNITLYAKWIPNQYEITFFSNGGNNIGILTFDYDALLNLPTPIKSGYLFLDWYTDIGLQNRFNLLKMPNYNFDLYAKYQLSVIDTNLYSLVGNFQYWNIDDQDAVMSRIPDSNVFTITLDMFFNDEWKIVINQNWAAGQVSPTTPGVSIQEESIFISDFVNVGGSYINAKEDGLSGYNFNVLRDGNYTIEFRSKPALDRILNITRNGEVENPKNEQITLKVWGPSQEQQFLTDVTESFKLLYPNINMVLITV